MRFRTLLFYLLSGGAAATALAAVIGLAAAALVHGAGALSWELLTAPARGSGLQGGLRHQILGTLILAGGACALVVPPAVGVGILLTEYLRPALARWLRGALYLLNGVPSILFGLFGFAVLVMGLGLGRSWLAGAVVLALMILPTAALALAEALAAVPPEYRAGALALGLSRQKTAWAVQLRQGVHGLATGLLLGLARAAGETAPIMFTAVVFSGATLPAGIRDAPVLALPYHIFVLAQDAADPRALANGWGAALVLMGLVALASLVALPLRLRAHEEAR